MTIVELRASLDAIDTRLRSAGFRDRAGAVRNVNGVRLQVWTKADGSTGLGRVILRDEF